MGILDGLNFGASGGGIPNWLEAALRSQAGMSQGFPQTQQGSPDALLPEWKAWLAGGPVPGQAPAPAPAAAPQMAPGAPAPMSSMAGAAGYGAGMDAPVQFNPAQLPPTAAPAIGQGAPAMPAPAGVGPPPSAAAGPGLFDRLSAGATNFTTGGNPIAGLLNMVGGLATGQRTDRIGIAQQNQAATANALYQALSKTGRYSPEEAKGIAVAAATNPALATALLPQAFGSKYEAKTIKGPLGDESVVAFDPVTGTTKAANSEGGSGMGSGGPQMLAPGVKKYDPTLSGPDYMAQFGPELQGVIKAYLNGDQMPTGNPRIQGMLPAAKSFAAKYAQDMGMPFSDTLYQAKRKMQTDLASSGNSSMGGILSNGDSAFAHLAELSGHMANLGNYSGPNIPGGGHIGDAGNYISNALLPSPQTKGKLEAIKDNALKYGQEATKLYAGTGGGEGERMHALNTIAAPGTNAEVQAAFLETEKSLMLDRVRSKIAQVRDTLGEEAAQKVIKEKMPNIEAASAKIDANIAKLRGGGAAAQPTQPNGAPDRAALEAEARRRGLLK